MFIFGNRLFGKVDTVPGLGFVATRFFHIDYVPLIPSQGWLVFQEVGKGWRGIRIPMSAKSVLLAWVRTASFVASVGGAIAAIAAAIGGRSGPLDIAGAAALSVVGWGVFAFSKLHKSVVRASYARASELAKLAKLNDGAMAALAAAYGQPPIAYGFEPLLSPAAVTPAPARVVPLPMPDADAVPIKEIRLNEMDGQPVDALLPLPVAPQRSPRQEVRRHG